MWGKSVTASYYSSDKGETVETEVRDYLQQLANDYSMADAAELIGYSRGSFNTIKRLYADYHVIVPVRSNQYAVDAPTRLSKAAEDDLPTDMGYAPKRFVLSETSRRTKSIERCLFVSDIHAPFQDDRAVSLVLSVAVDLQPEVIVFGGDICDFAAISKYNKSPARKLGLQGELDAAYEILKAFRDACPDARIVFVWGNHEIRLRDFLHTKAGELAGLEVLELSHLLRFDELGIEDIEGKSRSAYFQWGPIRMGHFDVCKKDSAYTAKALVDKYQSSVVQGHTHRLGTHYQTRADRMHVGVESGCLCSLDAEYVDDPDWQQGFTVITKREDEDRFHIVQVPIIGYEALFNDVLYAA